MRVARPVAVSPHALVRTRQPSRMAQITLHERTCILTRAV
nr:MAG TPA: hypothetical protein [Caudoviricetes sp.]